MTCRRSPLIPTLAALMLAMLAPAAAVRAQAQKYVGPSQKGLPRENLQQEPLQQGGYQAPPPSGAMQGPMREYGLSGGEIELPAIRLRLPRIRFPALSMFVTPPQMQTERSTAPLVQEFQEHVSVPAGSSSPPPTEAFTEPPSDRETQPYQKAAYEAGEAMTAAAAGAAPSSDQMAEMRAEMQKFESEMEAKISRLTRSIDLLLAQQQQQQQPLPYPPKPPQPPQPPQQHYEPYHQPHGDQPVDRGMPSLPLIREANSGGIRPSSYSAEVPQQAAIEQAPQLQRMPYNAPIELRRLPEQRPPAAPQAWRPEVPGNAAAPFARDWRWR